MNKLNPIADAFRQLACPRDSSGDVYPEFCKLTERHDHHLDVDGLAHAFKAHTRDE